VSPLPLLKLAKALARLKSPPRGRNGSTELLRPARGLLTTILPSLPVDSWPLPRHRVRRGTLFPSAQLWRPRSHPSSRLPQLRRPQRRGEERRRFAHVCFPGLIFLRPILIERLGPPQTTLRPILIERSGPQDTAPRALTPWPACQRPCPLALGPLGQCTLPLCR
jgi:hypothetical protein